MDVFFFFFFFFPYCFLFLFVLLFFLFFLFCSIFFSFYFIDIVIDGINWFSLIYIYILNLILYGRYNSSYFKI